MAKKWPTRQLRRKQRTRQHIIADQSANHVERHILSCGFAAELTRHDYGIDMFLSFYGQEGEPQNGMVLLQLKATDHLKLSGNGKTIAFSLARRDLHYWLQQPSPVILVVYDAKARKAYWLYVQAHFEANMRSQIWRSQITTTVNIPVKNILNRAAISRFQQYNSDVITQQQDKIHHHV